MRNDSEHQLWNFDANMITNSKMVDKMAAVKHYNWPTLTKEGDERSDGGTATLLRQSCSINTNNTKRRLCSIGDVKLYVYFFQIKRVRSS